MFAQFDAASCSLLSLFTYNVAPIPLLATEPLVTIQSWSDGRVSVMDLCSLRAFWAAWKCTSEVSVHGIASRDSLHDII